MNFLPDSIARIIFEYSYEKENEYYDVISKCRDEDIVLWFLDIQTSKFSNNCLYHIVLNCYLDNNLIVARLVKKYAKSRNGWEMQSSIVIFLCVIVATCTVDAIKQFIDEFNITKEDCEKESNTFIDISFIIACGKGLLDNAKWIASFFHVAKDKYPNTHKHSFDKACNNGHLEILKWLHSQFAFKPEEIEQTFRDAMGKSLHVTFPEMIQWIKLEFGFK